MGVTWVVCGGNPSSLFLRKEKIESKLEIEREMYASEG
jgi:hypothetical protein